MFRRVLRTTACGAVVGAVVGGYMYRSRLQDNRAILPEEFNKRQDMEAIQKQIGALLRKETSVAPLELYRYTTCPFCGKISALLQYHKLPHVNVEVDPMFKSQIKGHGYGKVPQVKFQDGSIIVDSAHIVEMICKSLPDRKWQDDLSNPEVKKWRDFANEVLVRYLVLNVNRSLFESWSGYGYIDQFDTIPYANKLFLKVVGAPVMYLVSQYRTIPHLQKHYGYNPSVNTPEQALQDKLKEWTTEGLGKKPFQGGKAPSIADIEVFGVLQSVRGHRVYDDIIAKVDGMDKWLSGMDAMMH